MYIDHIKTFLEVASSGSFQLSAENLHVTQSTVSARIRALEEQLNRPLFLRKRSGVEMTPGGKRFHTHATTVIRAWERARQEVALSEDLTAMIHLGVQINHWHHIAAPWLSWMRQHAPNMATQIVAEYSDALMRRLRDGSLELATLYSPQYCPGVVIEPLTQEKLILVSTKQRKLADKPTDDYVYVDWGENFRTQHSQAFPNISTNKLTVSLSSVALEHIRRHQGSAYLLEKSAKPLLEEGRLFRVQDAPTFELTLYLAWQEESMNPELLQQAIQGIREVAHLSYDQAISLTEQPL